MPLLRSRTGTATVVQLFSRMAGASGVWASEKEELVHAHSASTGQMAMV